MLYCGGGPSTLRWASGTAGSGATMRGTRKGLEGLGGLRNTEKGHNDEGIVSFLCMEQSTGAIAYPRKARPAASQQELPRAMMLNGWQGMRPKKK